jgi:anti-sigma factor RsiW
MDCSQCVDWTAPKLGGTLDERRMRELEEHLGECGRCRAELLLQEKIQAALSEDIPSGLSSDFTRRVCERTLAIAPRAGVIRLWPALLPAAAATLAAALALFLGGEVISEISSWGGPAFDSLRPPVVQVGEALLAGLTTVAGLLRVNVGPLGGLSPALATALVLTLASSLAAGWGLYQISAFLRE